MIDLNNKGPETVAIQLTVDELEIIGDALHRDRLREKDFIEWYQEHGVNPDLDGDSREQLNKIERLIEVLSSELIVLSHSLTEVK